MTQRHHRGASLAAGSHAHKTLKVIARTQPLILTSLLTLPAILKAYLDSHNGWLSVWPG